MLAHPITRTPQAGVSLNPEKSKRKGSNKRSLEEELKKNSDDKENR